jgi:hypothetical protein
MRAIKLPNGNIVLCDEDEMIEVSNVSIHLSSVISNDIEGFLDLLSEQATGCAGLMDINYDLCHCNPGGGELVFYVTGCAAEIDYEVLTTPHLPHL